MTEWKVERGPKRCFVTHREFEPGESYFSALLETDGGFERRDFGLPVWTEQDAAPFLAFWRTRRPQEGEAPKRRLVDTAAIHTLFDRLDGAERIEKQTFRYLLALILVRKRRLRLESIERADGGEFLCVYDRSKDELVRVRNPEPGADALAAAQAELSQVFDMDFDAAAFGSAPGDAAGDSADDEAEDGAFGSGDDDDSGADSDDDADDDGDDSDEDPDGDDLDDSEDEDGDYNEEDEDEESEDEAEEDDEEDDESDDEDFDDEDEELDEEEEEKND